jgi:hypothetical protein
LCRSSPAHRSVGSNCSDCTILGLFSEHGPVMVMFQSSHSLGTISSNQFIRPFTKNEKAVNRFGLPLLLRGCCSITYN